MEFLTSRTKSALTVLLLVSSSLAFSADPVQGRQHYQRHCAFCHGQSGQPTMPNAANFKRGDGLFKSDPELVSRIESGKNACPAFRGVLKREQLLDVVAFLRTLF